MLPKLLPLENQYGEPVAEFVPSEVTGMVALTPELREIWLRAKPYLRVRSNDAHTIYAFGIAWGLCDTVEGANPAVVLPAILLHDTGWSQVDEHLILRAISPSGGDPELVRLHEREGVRLAGEILAELAYPSALIEEIADIISTHDSMKLAKSVNDAIVKDADKIWRLTPHGIDTVMDWFGLTRDEAARLCSWRMHDYVHTEQGKQMARALAAIASVDSFEERIELG